MRIVFAGTPEFGLPCLSALQNSEHQIVAVYTQPDRPAGRGRKLKFSAIKTWALEHNILVNQPVNFKSQAAISELQALKPDLMVVIAYGLILPTEVLNIPTFGCVNVHASILPKWRGASPIHNAILNGDEETGVAIMQMDKGMDTGDYYQITACKISDDDTTGTLHDKLARIAINPLLETIHNIQNYKAIPIKQNSSLATYAGKIKKEDGKIIWNNSAQKINQQIRAFNPWPLAYAILNGLNLQIIQANVVHNQSNQQPGTILEISKQGMLVSTKEKSILIEKIKFPGKNTIAISDYLNSNQTSLQVGQVFL
ncbi:MAG: methionyl-tRNA formyltransferase [Legionellales bacterium RIFCSPHIGHO2_12_FULL_35_11]|nr:MAG: methionyl-tRNA formyltransferase [Legionellales bacterium RIFCSPHIGHO2_12_FULL_35_11]